MTYADYEYFLEENLTKYAGKWVAIVDEHVVASGKDATLVVKEAKAKYPTKRPFLAKVRNKLSIL